MVRLSFLYIVMFIIPIQLFSQEIRNFGFREYLGGPQVWGVVEDNQGIIYISTNYGISFYDGETWSVLDSSVKSKYIFKHRDNIYIGGYGEFGMIKHDSIGRPFYRKISKTIKIHGICRTICAADEQVVFNFNNFCYVFNEQTETITKLNLPNSKDRIIVIDNSFHILSRDHGIAEFSIQRGNIKEFSNLISDKILEIMDLDSNLLIQSVSDSLFLWNKKNEMVKNIFTPMSTGFEFIKGVSLRDKLFFVTERNGLVKTKNTGEIINILTSNDGLLVNSGRSIYADRQKNVWVGLEGGLSIISEKNAVNHKIKHLGQCIINFNGQFLIASTSGLLKYDSLFDNNSFILEKGLTTQCWDILKFNDSHALVISNTGVIDLNQDLKSKVIISGDAYGLMRSTLDSNRVYIGLKDGIKSLYFNHNNWIDQGYIYRAEDELKVKFILEHKNYLWFDGVHEVGSGKIQFKLERENIIVEKIKRFGQKDGLPHMPYSIKPCNFNDELLFGCDSGFLRYNEKQDLFVRYEEYNNLIGLRYIHRLKYQDHKLWCIAYDELDNNIVGYFERTNGRLSWNNIPFRPFKKNAFHDIYIASNGKVYFTGVNSVLEYDPSKEFDYEKPFNTTIRKVGIGEKDSSIYFGKKVPLKYNIDYQYNTLHFRVAAQEYVSKEKKYSFYLEGFDASWSNWNTLASRSYTNLPEGKYTLKVKGKNDFDIESKIDTFTFTINPPWYRTWWSYGSYAVIAFTLVTGSTKMYNRNLKKQVKASTFEIKRKSKYITKSVDYAQNIQKAILKNIEAPNTFLFFKPRDQVSGDFPWYHVNESNQTRLYSIADCTGHGIPGALLSILGTSLFDEITHNNEQLSTNEIFDILKAKVTAKLQSQYEKSEDGIDAALISISKQNHLQYTGANNPIYIIRKEPLKQHQKLSSYQSLEVSQSLLYELKPDFITLGYNRTDRDFSKIELKLEKGDCVYLFSDGFMDQFGGASGKKYGLKRFKELLLQVEPEHMHVQKEMIAKAFASWMNEYNQVDDVSVLGIRI
ncbi:MAG: SpoIIE family protein phosphatase [Flavobacteriales bacterium]|nr:SpoIIE family protein phosphatase [Flavobacteriales bacterium]